MKQVNVRFDEKTLDRVHSTRIPQSEFIREAVEFYLESQAWLLDSIQPINVIQRIERIEDQIEDINSNIKTQSKRIERIEKPTEDVKIPTSRPKRIDRITDDHDALVKLKAILGVIKEYHDTLDIEPTVGEVADRLGYNTRAMGTFLGKFGVHAKNTTRNGLVSRYFTFDMREDLDKLEAAYSPQGEKVD